MNTPIKEDESGLPVNRLWQPTTAKWFFVVFGVSLAYAILRYHIAGDVSWSHFPLFILNKVTALSAVIFVACSYLIGKVIRWHDDNKALRLVVIKFCGLVGFFLAGIHAFMSVMLMDPAYLAKYFEPGGQMNLLGELGMAVGVVALFFLMSRAITTLPMMPKALGGKRWKRSQRIGYVSLLLVAVHLVVLGVNGWMAPGHWTSGLPPISLFAFLAAVTPLVVKRKVTVEKQKRDEARQS
jgi:DMSO/TMAO reductase YedYZ heme-binding membrane subunit